MPIGSALTDRFDAVIMFTWSNWKTEPRSNRYHYAIRFARHLPVHFVQQTDPPPGGAQSELVEDGTIWLHHAGRMEAGDRVARVRAILERFGIRRPLVWVYNATFDAAIDPGPDGLLVYHATEDYFGAYGDARMCDDEQFAFLERMIERADLAVAVSQSVANSLANFPRFRGSLLTLKNGCDPAVWEAPLKQRTPSDRKVAFYQGGVNARLDFALLHSLAHRMPDWQFWFCGDHSDAPRLDWLNLCTHDNVHAFGALPIEQVAEYQARATVGLIPFNQTEIMRISLPLKAYEYVASGLPVVSIPIYELEQRPDLFSIAQTVEEFESHIRRLAPTRWQADKLQLRSISAKENSYDGRFELLLEELRLLMIKKTQGNASSSLQTGEEAAITGMKSAGTEPRSDVSSQLENGESGAISPSVACASAQEALASQSNMTSVKPRRLRVLVAYSGSGVHVQTTADYLRAFSQYFDAETAYVNVTNDAVIDFDIHQFDVVFNSYCARWPVLDHVSKHYAVALKQFTGVKILAVQDEYERTDNLKKAINDLKFDVVLTCVPEDQIEKVYPAREFPNTDFFQVLTGYVPGNISELSKFSLPLAERKVMVGYRGRDIGGRYGKLGWDKLEIGRRVKAACDRRKWISNIDWTEESRIYGQDWFRFLGSCRATLGSPSGSNVFDFDGAIERQFNEMAKELGERPSYETFLKIVAEKDAAIDMGQISPKVFEAVALRTPLILLQGRYSGVVSADVHYISLNSDYSNLEEVLDRLNDLHALEVMTERAYADLIESGAYGYPVFVKRVETIIREKLAGKSRPHILPPMPDPATTLAHMNPEDFSFLAEKATPDIAHSDTFWLKRQQYQTAIYRRELARINDVYTNEIARLAKIIQDEAVRYQTEYNRLTGLLTESQSQVATQYQTYARELKSALDQAEASRVELAQLRQADVQRVEQATQTLRVDTFDRLERAATDAGNLAALLRASGNEDAGRAVSLAAELAALRSSTEQFDISLSPAPAGEPVTIPDLPSAPSGFLGTGIVVGLKSFARRSLWRLKRSIRNAPGLGPLAIRVHRRIVRITQKPPA